MEIVVFVILFSIIQSIFGVGLLLFGTPTLLLLGFDFDQTLWMLLPSSIFISLYQIIGRFHLVDFNKEVYVYTLPPLVAGLIFVVTFSEYINIKILVGFFLLFVSILRISKKMNMILKKIIKKYIRSYCFLMGLIHGVSNMGGGFLAVLMSSTYDLKNSIRVNIAFVYLIFGISQLIALSFISPHDFLTENIYLVVVSSCTYFISRNFIKVIHHDIYQTFITYLILIYAILTFFI